MKSFRLYILGLGIATAFVIPSATIAAKPPGQGGNALTLAATPSITFGRAITLSGQLTGSGNSGVSVRLQENPFPYTGGFKAVPNVQDATTDASGNFSFPNVVPQLNTRYQAVAKKPKATSPAAQVNVRLAVTRSVSRSTISSGKRVRFSGVVRPAHDGKAVLIQRRGAGGKWRTVSKTVTTHSTAGQSTYSKRVRIAHTGTYRVRVNPADGDHATGTSRRKKIRVV